MLWIALHLPHLPLQALLRGGTPGPSRDEPWAVIENHSVVACNAAAHRQGVKSGMPLAAAWVIAPALRTVSRQVRVEQETLEGAAAWLSRFTPRISLEAPCQIALEVAGSLRFWGGLERLMQDLRSGLDALGLEAQFACAPTIRAALWRAAGSGEALEDLPVEIAASRPGDLELLRNLGIGTLRELMQLPRDGVARRLGQELLDALDRALGVLPEPRAWFSPPQHFVAQLELPWQVTEAGGLLFAAHRLLVQLEGLLVARQSGIRSFALSLQHSGGSPTRIAVSLAHLSRDAAHLTALLRERLGRIALAAPVTAILLEACNFEPLYAATDSLFRSAHDTGESWDRLLERLVARLGKDAVQGLAVRAEHRPELASQPVSPVLPRAPGAVSPGAPEQAGPRPLWLLDKPRSLKENGFVLLAGPERIESGWWDGRDVRRDYFIARSAEGSLVWIFRTSEGGWFLHGLFA